MERISFILNGTEYCATFEDGDCVSVYNMTEHRYLNIDNETGFREQPSVWIAAYTMVEE